MFESAKQQNMKRIIQSTRRLGNRVAALWVKILSKNGPIAFYVSITNSFGQRDLIQLLR